MRHLSLMIVLTLFLFSFTNSNCEAASVALEPMKDNTLYEDAIGSLSNGSGSYIFTGATDFNFLRRALLSFDIAGNVPSGSQIDSVTLELNMSKTISGAQINNLHRVLADWGEGASDALGQEGGGTAPAPDDATWIHTFYDTSFWATFGGEYDIIVSASQSITGIGKYTWGSTAQMALDVQNWLDTPAINFGWIIIGDESTSPTTKRFDSRENATAGNRPILTVYYTPLIICGDADGGGSVDISDAVYLIAFIFGGGPAPDSLEAGDADCGGTIDISDAVYLIAFIFGGGPAPCATCP